MITSVGPSGLRPIGELVEPKSKRPETALTLENALKDPLGTIESFELPPSIERHFETILDAVAERYGRGFWIQSEYGGGKTHFIAALTALLAGASNGSDCATKIWAALNDADIKERKHEFVNRRILAVAVSCKGIMPIDGQYSRAFLHLLMDGLSRALKARGLEEKVPVTGDQEMINHFASRPPDLKMQIDAWCKQRHGCSVTELLETEGPELGARAYRAWWNEFAGGVPDVELNVVDWLATLCRRLQNAGFDGLLVVIDEFATLQNLATTTADVAAYEDILESLGWLVPQRLVQQDNSTFGIYTIVASQKGHPTKLDERFTLMPLLAKDAARDYEIIVSRRVRVLRKERLPEIDQYYHHHKLTHDTYASMPIDRFREVFPFQPRVFEAIWSITATGGDVAAARFGIAAIWDTLKQPGILESARLLTVSDLLRSEQFRNDLTSTAEYKDAFVAYQAAGKSALSLGFPPGDLELAQRVLDALFVDYLASRRSPRWLKTQEIAEAVLATSDSIVIPPADQVLTILDRLRQLSQVKFEPSRGAKFEASAVTGPLPLERVNKAKQELGDNDPRLQSAWSDLLQVTSPAVGLWSELKLDSPKPTKSLHERVQYQGVIELRRSFAKGQGLVDLSHNSGRHFHIIVLTQPAGVSPDDLDDPRVAVVMPGQLTSEEIDLCKTYVACQTIMDNPSLMSGTDGPPLRAYCEQQRKEAARKIIARQNHAYRRGHIVSRTAVAFNPDSTFHGAQWKDAVDAIVDRLLGAAYDRLSVVLRHDQFKGNSRFDPTTDAGKVFAGLIAGSTQNADVGAAQNFGPALGLSKQMFPHDLNLDQEHFGISLLLQRMTNAGRGGISTENLYETLCGAPYGVPHEVVTLWLLAMVRAATVGTEKRRVEIELQKNAKARLKGGIRLPTDAITFLNVKNLEWASSLRSDFLSIRVSEEVPFGDVVEYGKVFDATLKSPAVPEQVESEEQRLQQAIDAARQHAERTQTALNGLAAAVNQSLPKDVVDTVVRLVRVLTLGDDYQREHFLTQMRQAYRSAADLHIDWTKVQGWSRLASHAADMGSLHQFLRNLVGRLGANPGRYQKVVEKASIEVLPRMDLAALLAAPSTIEAVLQAAQNVRDAYVNEYRIHHRDYFESVAALRSQMGGIRRQAAILTQLNKLQCAGPPALPDPMRRVTALESRLQMCPHADRSDINVSVNLTCQEDKCSLPGPDPLAKPPALALASLSENLEYEIRQRVNAVKAKAITAILQRSPDPQIGTFLAIVQAGQLDGLLEVLDDKLVAMIDQVLQEARIRVAPTGAIARVAERFAVIQRNQIIEVIEALRVELERAFDELQREHPDEVIQLRLSLEERE